MPAGHREQSLLMVPNEFSPLVLVSGSLQDLEFHWQLDLSSLDILGIVENREHDAQEQRESSDATEIKIQDLKLEPMLFTSWKLLPPSHTGFRPHGLWPNMRAPGFHSHHSFHRCSRPLKA